METLNGYTLLQQTGTEPSTYNALSPAGEDCELRLCAPWSDGTPDPLALCYAKNQWALAHCYAHPNIQKTQYMWSGPNGVVTVVERCTGGTLESHVLENVGPLPITCAMGIMTQILDALGHIHETNVEYKQAGCQRYGQLEPWAILLTEVGAHPAVKLRAPFLIVNDEDARSLDYERVSDTYDMSTKYNSPMQRFYFPRWVIFNWRYQKPVNDLWAAAALLYFMLTCCPPRMPLYKCRRKEWEDIARTNKWVELAIYGSVIPFAQRGVTVPKPLEQLLISMLSAETPQKMPYHTAAAFKEALLGAV